MSVGDNLRAIQSELGSGVRLIAVSKTFPVERIREAYETGQRDFGENRVQEMIAKQPQLPEDIRWHQIGHLQTNKVRYIAPFVALIHAVDSEKLLREIDRQAAKHNRVIDVLLQIHIADEVHKFGFTYAEAEALLDSGLPSSLPNVKIRGFMGMATFTSETEKIRNEFEGLHQFLIRLQQQHPTLTELSTGMSGDYRIALETGSTMVRVGSAIFGNR